jgi:hypothetical protein
MTAPKPRRRKNDNILPRKELDSIIASHGLPDPFEPETIQSYRDRWNWEREVNRQLPSKEAHKVIVSFMFYEIKQAIEKILK